MTRRCDIAVLGAGSWGTALAILLARNGHRTLLWGRGEAMLATLARHRGNERYLPGQRFPERLAVEPDLSRAAGAAGACLLAVPSHAFEEMVAAIAGMPAVRQGLLWATKGLDPSSGRLLHEVAAERLPCGAALGVLSGPTFAREVARRLPTAVTLAATDGGFAREWATRLANPRFRVYTGEDLAGVQVAGAVKNVLAVAAGIADGLGFGANTRAALIARGLAEMVRLGEAAGGRAATFMGLAGTGRSRADLHRRPVAQPEVRARACTGGCRRRKRSLRWARSSKVSRPARGCWAWPAGSGSRCRSASRSGPS